MQEIPFFPVNWVDGMKINRTHFQSQEQAFIYQTARAAASLLNPLNYGLLPAAPLKLFVTVDHQQQVQARVQQCRAITAGGYYIEFSEDTALSGSNMTTPLLSTPTALGHLRQRAEIWYVVLTINPYKRVAYGSADPAESPARLPYTLPLYTIDLLAADDVAKNKIGDFQLPVGRLVLEEQRLSLDESYIPPCTAVSSHAELLATHAALEEFFSRLESCSLQIMQKILQKKQSNELSIIVQKICEQLLSFTAVQLAEWKSSGIVQPPVYMVSRTAALARLLKNGLDTWLGSGKEELVNYFTDWCNFSQGELEASIVQMAGHVYDHLDISVSLSRIAVFTSTISQLFHQLARLEYIGKRKDAGIFVKEEALTPGGGGVAPVAPKRRSFLAE